MIKLLLSLLVAASAVSCTKSSSTEITLENASKSSRVDEAFVVKRSELIAPNAELRPALQTQSGTWIASQCDDLDGDGEWDELAFICDLSAGESKALNIVWLEEVDYPCFDSRTNIRYGKAIDVNGVREVVELFEDSKSDDYMVKSKQQPGYKYPFQMDGPAWENDKVGFRVYFDGRNGRDVFGKLVPEMVLDGVGIGDSRYDRDNDWGRDILYAVGSFGLGGIAATYDNSITRLGVVDKYTIDNVKLTTYKLVSEGPVRSIISMDYLGWRVADGDIDVHNIITIWAGKYGYENKITTSTLPDGVALITGIVTSFNNEPCREQEYNGRHISMSTHDKQSVDKRWYMGMSLIIPSDNVARIFDAPSEDSAIIDTWCAELKPNDNGDYHFNAYAAWELSESRFADSALYYAMIDEYANNISELVKLTIK